MPAGFEDIDDILDPAFDVPVDVEPSLAEMLPRGYLSVSQAGRFLKCPRQWELIYVDQKPQRTSARMFQGVQVHSAVEAVLQDVIDTGVVPPLERATDTFSDAFDAQKALIEDWEGEDEGLVKDTGIRCTKVFHQEAAPLATPVSVETSFHAVITSADGKVRLPLFGRIDNIQVQVHTREEYQRVRETLKTNPVYGKPLRLHDLKVSMDKWTEDDVKNDLQLAVYGHAQGVPDVQIDNLVKGRGKRPRPRLETVTGVMTPSMTRHALAVVEDVGRSIAMGHFPRTDPSNWWCGEKWCSVWRYCRGA